MKRPRKNLIIFASIENFKNKRLIKAVVIVKRIAFWIPKIILPVSI